MKFLVILSGLFFSCSILNDEPYNEIEVYCYNSCTYSFFINGKKIRDYDCQQELSLRISNVPADTLIFKAITGKKTYTSKKYHAGGVTKIDFSFP